MFIPLGTDRPLRRPTVVTHALILITVAVFLAQFAGQITAAGSLAEAGESGPSPIEQALALRTQPPGVFRWWMPITYAFLHGGWLHLIGNMAFLWVFGPNLEDRLGRLRFLAFYLGGAAAAGGLHILFSRSGVVGASGAIAACTGAYLVMFPRTMIKVLGLMFYIGIFTLPAWWFIGLGIAWDLASQTLNRGSGIAHLAHLGGYAYGIGIAFFLLGTKLVPGEPYDLMSDSRQAIRRRTIKAAAGQRQKQVETHWERANSPQLAAARAEVARLMGAGQTDQAAAAYKRLANDFPASAGTTALSRRHQYDLANHFYTTGDQSAAVYAYERFLEAYPKDPESPQIRLLLGRITARHLNDPVRAKALLTEAIAGLRDEEVRAMAKRELEALG